MIGNTEVTCNQKIWENICKVTSRGLLFFQNSACGPLVRPSDGVESPKAELPVVCLGIGGSLELSIGSRDVNL